ncbi:sulfate adenylyltransferase subunit CysN [Pseudomonas sp. PDM10]|uniref:sulfate adenylyltransferase subunit CysN n=1 Tax=Pseudomonas sp. PDM10 TaxID=2769269 RepID=UPI00177CFF66|nr:sulfate adenylyltransferase subunit CysN [Pseudomonas sp. PDM10]MBD9599169.1 sulfate adenylyltransferase subunit CysN [Pseudomonas sp. PDM10]
MAPNAQTTATAMPSTIEAYLEQQQGQDLLRFITCGSVDDGKSTLIGRLLWDARQLTDDQLAALKNESKKYGTQGAEIDFALLVDGLSAEREQGITIDVAYRYFATAKRKFIVADTPGHEQYTRNMVTGASTADVAIILIDARQGVLTQTRRHAYLASLMGIRQVVLAVNKMDLVGFDPSTFQHAVDTFQAFAHTLGFERITPIPVSALKGDNITQRSANTPWYSGPTLMGCLETIEVNVPESARLVFPVQWVNRPDASFRGFSGYVAEGKVIVGDEVRVTLSGHTATVTEIVSMDGPMQEALCGDAVTLKLSKEIDVSRGDIISLSQRPLETTDQFEAMLVWMNEEAGLHGRNYDIKLATQWASASITNIKYRVDINTLAHDASTQLSLNDISVCTLATSKPLVYDSYKHSRTLGSFILVDRISNATVAAGMITHSLRRAQNVHTQVLSISRENREKLNGHKGKVIWFTGLSGSGKSTLANALEVELHASGYRTYLLDGDNVRQGLNKDLGFTDADRVENIRRIAEVAKLMMDAGLIVMTAFISPFRRERQMARELIGEENFVEVFVSTPLEVCEARDVKGLYRKARSGQLPNLSGVGSPYEPPHNAKIEIGSNEMTISDSISTIVETINL